MEPNVPPIPENELERIFALSSFDLDYSNLKDHFNHLMQLAAKVAGTEISLINLIDSYTQWTVATHNFSEESADRQETVCQYTIMSNDYLEVKDLSNDNRFKDKPYVTGKPNLRYYFGIPLTTLQGYNIGALCVIDKQPKQLSPEKIEMLHLIAEEIMVRFATLKEIELLKAEVAETKNTKRSLAHDIRGPLGGIMGLAKYISEQGDENKLEDVLKLVKIMHNSSHSLLDLAEEILGYDQPVEDTLKPGELNLVSFKETLEKLYAPQALAKNINFSVSISNKSKFIKFSKNKLLQITGNLISNALKFTPENGQIEVALKLLLLENEKSKLIITVKDSGIGMNNEKVLAITNGKGTSSRGTNGELGYGFGLPLVKHLVESLNGTLDVSSDSSKGSLFTVSLPQKVSPHKLLQEMELQLN